MFYCYIIANATDRTYNGYTNNLTRRLRQHNGEIKGGARATHGRGPWRYVAILSCPVWTGPLAMKCEWKIKYPTGRRPRPSCYQGAGGRIRSLLEVFTKLTEEELVLFIDDMHMPLLGVLPEKIARKTLALADIAAYESAYESSSRAYQESSSRAPEEPPSPSPVTEGAGTA